MMNLSNKLIISTGEFNVDLIISIGLLHSIGNKRVHYSENLDEDLESKLIAHIDDPNTYVLGVDNSYDENFLNFGLADGFMHIRILDHLLCTTTDANNIILLAAINENRNVLIERFNLLNYKQIKLKYHKHLIHFAINLFKFYELNYRSIKHQTYLFDTAKRFSCNVTLFESYCTLWEQDGSSIISLSPFGGSTYILQSKSKPLTITQSVIKYITARSNDDKILIIRGEKQANLIALLQ